MGVSIIILVPTGVGSTVLVGSRPSLNLTSPTRWGFQYLQTSSFLPGVTLNGYVCRECEKIMFLHHCFVRGRSFIVAGKALCFVVIHKLDVTIAVNLKYVSLAS